MALAMQARRSGRISIPPSLSLLLFFGVICVGFSALTPFFLTGENLATIASTIAIVGIVAIGETLVLIAGGVDISVGTTAALAGVLTSVFLLQVGIQSIWLCALLALVGGALVGALNGVLVVGLKINPLIATFGTYSIARGAAWVLSGGQTNLVTDVGFQFLGRGTVGVVPFSLILMIGLYIVFSAVLRYTAFGRNLYAIGGSRDAARLAGINVNRHLFAAFILCGLLAALGGLINVSQLASTAPRAVQGLEFTVIAAVVLGGTGLSGGKGTLIGTFLGVLILRTVDNGLVLLGVPSFYQEVARGVILLFAVAVDQVRQRLTGSA